jgi:hypothetical protein
MVIAPVATEGHFVASRGKSSVMLSLLSVVLPIAMEGQNSFGIGFLEKIGMPEISLPTRKPSETHSNY